MHLKESWTIVGQLLFLTGSRDIFKKTDGEQPKGHLGLHSKAEEEEEDVDDDDDDNDDDEFMQADMFSTLMLQIPKTCCLTVPRKLT